MKKVYTLIEQIVECQITENEAKVLAVSEDKEKIEELFLEKVKEHLEETDVTLEDLSESNCYYSDDSDEEYILGSDHFTHTDNEVFDYGSEMFWGYYIKESTLI